MKSSGSGVVSIAARGSSSGGIESLGYFLPLFCTLVGAVVVHFFSFPFLLVSVAVFYLVSHYYNKDKVKVCWFEGWGCVSVSLTLLVSSSSIFKLHLFISSHYLLVPITLSYERSDLVSFILWISSSRSIIIIDSSTISSTPILTSWFFS